MRLSKPEIAYIAGLFDGEGCINFTNNRNELTYLRVVVVNTNYDILKYLQDTFGGSISELKRVSPKWKQAYQWSLTWAAALNFVDKVSPWLKIKHKQAHVAHAFAEIKKLQRKKTITKKQFSEILEFLKQQLTYLNSRGPKTQLEPLDKLLGELKCLSSTEKVNKQSPKI